MKPVFQSARAVATTATWLLAGVLSIGMAPLAQATAPVLLVASHNTDSVLKFDGTTGNALGTFIGAGAGGLDGPQGMTIGPDGNLYVASWYTNSIKRYDAQTGAYLGDFVQAGAGGLRNPDAVRFGPDGGLYVSDRFGAEVLRYSGQTGVFDRTLVSDSALFGFIDFAFGPDHNLYASMFNGVHRIRRYDGTTGAFIDSLGEALPSANSAYAGIAFGTDGLLYSSRFHVSRIERLATTPGGANSVFVAEGLGGLDHPRALSFGPDGLLYVASQNSNKVLRYDAKTGAFVGTFISVGLDSATSLAFVQVNGLYQPGGDGLTFSANTPVPEPSTAMLLLGGLIFGCLHGVRRRSFTVPLRAG